MGDTTIFRYILSLLHTILLPFLLLPLVLFCQICFKQNRIHTKYWTIDILIKYFFIFAAISVKNVIIRQII